jgi:hypothetical protein
MPTNTTINTRILRNGTIVDADTGKIVKGEPLSPDKARAMQAKKVEKLRKAKETAIREAVHKHAGTTRIPSTADSVGYVTETIMTEIVLEPGQPAGTRIRAWESVEADAGLRQPAPAPEAGQTQHIQQAIIINDPAASAKLAEITGRFLQPGADEGE